MRLRLGVADPNAGEVQPRRHQCREQRGRSRADGEVAQPKGALQKDVGFNLRGVLTSNEDQKIEDLQRR